MPQATQSNTKEMKKLDYASLFTLRTDGRFMYRWTDGQGKRHTIYDRNPEALFRKVEALDDKRPKAFGEIAAGWQAWQWDRVAYKTSEAYTAPLRRIIDRWGDDDPEDITAQEISAYLSALAKQGYSRRSVQMHRDILAMIFRYGIVNCGLKYNPVDAVSLPRNLPSTRRELPDDAAIEAVKSSSAPFSLFAKLCLYSGLRRGEALALRYEDIDRERRQIHVTKAVEYIGNSAHIKAPKTEAGRRDAVLLDVLAEQIPSGKGYIFCRQDGGPLSKMQFRDRWLAYCAAIGHDITPHQLRHGFATILYEAGIEDKDAMELMGHSSIAVTRDIYTHIRQTRREETTAKLNRFVTSIGVKTNESIGNT